jgi:hypothetical protein
MGRRLAHVRPEARRQERRQKALGAGRPDFFDQYLHEAASRAMLQRPNYPARALARALTLARFDAASSEASQTASGD